MPMVRTSIGEQSGVACGEPVGWANEPDGFDVFVTVAAWNAFIAKPPATAPDNADTIPGTAEYIRKQMRNGI